MYSDTKITRSVADAVNKIMNPQQVEEELKGGQKKIDKNHNGKIDGQDFAILRGQKDGVKKEEVEELDELSKDTLHSYVKKSINDKENLDKPQTQKGLRRATSRLYKEGEEAEQILEYETDKNGKFVHNAKAGKYGGSEKPQDPFAGVRGPGQKDLAKIEAEKKKKKFSEMVNLYQDKGLKSLSEMLKKEDPIEEGASEEQFNDQLKVAQFKANTKDDDTVRAVKKKTTSVATPLEVGVKQTNVNYEETEVVDYPLDVDAINGTSIETIEEREMTGSEMEKRETIVKSMKKGMQGFKDRYGDRAKNVMYATATKQAMK